MLAGCSSTLLSPRYRLRSEATSQFQACHHPMSTQRIDLPCTFPRKDVSKPQSVRPVGLSVEKPVEVRALKQTIRVPPSPEGRREIKADFWGDRRKSLKRRLAEQGSSFDDGGDESCVGRTKRKKGSFDFGESDEISPKIEDTMSFGHLGSGGNFWVHPGFGVVNVNTNYPQVPFSLTCSGEEERVCFVPTDVISPAIMPPLSHNPWVESGVTEVTEYGGGDKDGEPSHGFVRGTTTTSGSSSSSESHSFGHRLNESSSDPEIRNGSMLPNPGHGPGTSHGPGTGLAHNHNDQTEQQGFELISFLMGCVEAISSRNIAAINHFIAKLGEQASPRARSAISRLTAYFTEALALRVTRFWPHIFHISIPREFDRFDDESGAAAMRLLNQISPIPKFVHFTANEMLLRAFEGKDKVHIIDFDIKQGLQWPGFFQSLAMRENPPSHVRITGVGDSKQELVETGERLAGFAGAFNLSFEFHPVVDRLEDVRLWMLHVKEGESVAVNCILQLHKTLYDPHGATFRDFMGLIRSTNPIALVMAEQEADHNEPTLEGRVCNSLGYYAALFDAIDCSLPFESSARLKIEEMFGREIRNIIACEGADRIERHEKFEKWKRRIEQEGFRCMRTSEREVMQSQMLLKMYSNESYNMQRQGNEEAITLVWLDQPLYTVSLWAPSEFAAGSSSSFSLPS